MTNQEIIARIERWQNAGTVHPLTCGRDACGADLEPLEHHGKVILVCPAMRCGYTQDWIPPIVLAHDPPPPHPAPKKDD